MEPFEENIDNQYDMEEKTYSPTLSVYSLSIMNDYYNLLLVLPYLKIIVIWKMFQPIHWQRFDS